MIPTGIFTKFREIAAGMTSDLGQYVVLYYDTPQYSVATGIAAPYGLTTFDADGNPVHLGSLGTNFNIDGTNLIEIEATGVIKARVYSVNDSFLLNQLGAKQNDNIYRMNCLLIDVPAIMRAKHIIITPKNSPIERIKAVMIKPPASYGLGDTFEAISYWRLV